MSFSLLTGPNISSSESSLLGIFSEKEAGLENNLTAAGTINQWYLTETSRSKFSQSGKANAIRGETASEIAAMKPHLFGEKWEDYVTL